MAEVNYSLDDKARWWRKQIRAGMRTEQELADWILEHAVKWSESERSRFQLVYDGTFPKWDKWKRNPPVSNK